MRIAQVAPVNHHISTATRYGVAHNVAHVCNGLVDLGHKVTLFSAGDAEIRGTVAPSVVEANTRSLGISDNDALPYNHLNLSACFAKAKSFDIIHAHYNLIALYYDLIVDTPVLHTVHNPLPETFLNVLPHIRHQNFVSISHAQRKQYPELNWVANIYHGIDTAVYAYNETPKDYMLFLGRIIPEKGVHHAIAAAKAAKVPLIIAGMSNPADSYWQTQIEPHIDGKHVSYVGHADLQQKLTLLQNARALLFPSIWEEPFGLAMIEALSCGTPVIGWKSGSVPEVVQDGETGYVVKSVNGMTKAIKAIDAISRQACRKRAERLFSVEKMVGGYERVYERIATKRKRK